MHVAPHFDCTCGIYIANDIKVAGSYGVVLGKVQGWGNTVKHGQGWRVQHAYPSELYVHTVEEALLLADYGVPVHLAEDVTDKNILRILKSNPAYNPTPVAAPPEMKGAYRALTSAVALAGLGTIANASFFVHNPTILGGSAFAVTALMTGFLAGMRSSR